MHTYNVPRLTNKTPQADQTKLLDALKAVKGVEAAKLQVGASTFTIDGKDKGHPSIELIQAAALQAGFPVSKPMPKPDSKPQSKPAARS